MVDLVLGDPAVREQLNTVQVTANIRAEENGHLTHIITCAHSTKRHVSKHTRLLFIGDQNRESRRLNVARAQHIDANAATFEIIDATKGERTQRCLARVVDGKSFESFDECN